MGIDFIIAGGGIGGLSSALALARAGRSSLVLERSTAFGEIGAGIQLGPNAFHCFDWLGVRAEADRASVFIDDLLVKDALSLETLLHMPLQEGFLAKFGNPYAVVHRGDLHRALLAGCEASDLISLQTSSEVTGYEQDDRQVTVFLKNGTRLQAAGLIGADGLRSAIRAQLVGDGPPVICGHTTYRSVIRAEEMPESLRWNAATLWAGPKCHLVHYPLSGWQRFNLVVTTHNEPDEAVAGLPVSHDEVRAGFAGIADLPRSLIEIGRDWKKWVLSDRPPVENWVDGRVALLGDAAHPTLQYFAQGACMALEDAVALGDIMANHSQQLEAGLLAYNARRLARTARIQTGSRLIGEYFLHPEGAMRVLRNSWMQSKSAEDWYDLFDWVYGGNGLSEAPALPGPVMRSGPAGQ